MMRNAAIVFEPEAYVLTGPQLLGRQAAGNAYLRAAVEGAEGEVLSAYTPRRQSAEVFTDLVRGIDPRVETRWISPGRPDLLGAVGTLHYPGPALEAAAGLRLRAGLAAYSLTGVTHTTASHRAMDAIAALPRTPLMPWDALICTSRAVLDTVSSVLAAEREYLAWRLGVTQMPAMPELPVIPLGVHTRDFAFGDEERASARRELGLGPDTVAALFVGRLSFHAKAHPHAMYRGLEAVARKTGISLALIQCGWFSNSSIETAFKSGAASYSPSIGSIFTDGRDAAARRRSWAAADLFISLSDNVQETFGLAPVEAMAAGLPVVATDWDGYRDTVRDRIDGFLVPTAMPMAGFGRHIAAMHEAEDVNYDQYCGLVCRLVSVDHDVLAQRLGELVMSAELRRRFGEAGRTRARSEFDWSVIYARYKDLWAELGARRAHAARTSGTGSQLARAPRELASRLDPMLAFASYPTHAIRPDTGVTPAPGVSLEAYRCLKTDPLFSYLAAQLPLEDVVAGILDRIGANGGRGATVAALSAGLGVDTRQALNAVGVLAKMGLVRLGGH